MSIGGYNHELHKNGAETHFVDYKDDGNYYVDLDRISVYFHINFNKISQCFEIINKNKPLQIMIHGKWQIYSHYEMSFDSTTIWFMDNQTGGRIPVNMNQIEKWRAVDVSDELKSAIAELKAHCKP